MFPACSAKLVNGFVSGKRLNLVQPPNSSTYKQVDIKHSVSKYDVAPKGPVIASNPSPGFLYTSSRPTVIPVTLAVTSSGYPSYSYSSIPQLVPSKYSDVSKTLSRSSLVTAPQQSYPTYLPPNKMKGKLFTPLIPHKQYRTTQSLKPKVNDAVKYHTVRSRESESNL